MTELTERTAARLVAVVNAAADRLRGIDDGRAGTAPGAGKWCPKEVIGHLLDSAANNHQRFIRAQLVPELVLPGYEQDRWVNLQGYAAARWGDLIDLWRLYNVRLAEVIRRIPQETLATPCRIGGGSPVTLGFIVGDYTRHLEHHLSKLGVSVP